MEISTDSSEAEASPEPHVLPNRLALYPPSLNVSSETVMAATAGDENSYELQHLSPQASGLEDNTRRVPPQIQLQPSLLTGQSIRAIGFCRDAILQSFLMGWIVLLASSLLPVFPSDQVHRIFRHFGRQSSTEPDGSRDRRGNHEWLELRRHVQYALETDSSSEWVPVRCRTTSSRRYEREQFDGEEIVRLDAVAYDCPEDEGNISEDAIGGDNTVGRAVDTGETYEAVDTDGSRTINADANYLVVGVGHETNVSEVNIVRNAGTSQVNDSPQAPSTPQQGSIRLSSEDGHLNQQLSQTSSLYHSAISTTGTTAALLRLARRYRHHSSRRRQFKLASRMWKVIIAAFLLLIGIIGFVWTLHSNSSHLGMNAVGDASVRLLPEQLFSRLAQQRQGLTDLR